MMGPCFGRRQNPAYRNNLFFVYVCFIIQVMKTKYYLLLFASVLLWAQMAEVRAQDSLQISKIKKVYCFKIFDEINPATWRTTQQALREASEVNADLILLHLNTYGGRVDNADSIRTALLYSKIPVWVFIDNNAASAGALISIACSKIFMRQGANIGAATVVNQNAEAMPDKYQSYMRSIMRSTAEARGRDPHIAEAMVDPDVFIEGIIDSGKVLTFTASEAQKHGFCDGTAESIEELLKKNGLNNVEVVKQELSATDKIINFFLNPFISGLLIMLIIGGIYFELQTPGIGFPLIVAVIGAVLYFVPYYLQGLAEHWEILVFIIGLILLALEIFVIPGFGVTGILGILLVIMGLGFSMISNNGVSVPGGDYGPMAKALGLSSFALFAGLVGSFFLGKRIISKPVFGHSLALNETVSLEEGYIGTDSSLNSLVGRSGIAHTILRPSGKVEIDEMMYEAVARTGYIEAGEVVKILGFENNQLIVIKEI